MTVQFIADKIPAVDSVWDLIDTFIRIPAGAILAAAAVTHLDPKIRLLALLIGGGVALTSHRTKTATRLAANQQQRQHPGLQEQQNRPHRRHLLLGNFTSCLIPEPLLSCFTGG